MQDVTSAIYSQHREHHTGMEVDMGAMKKEGAGHAAASGELLDGRDKTRLRAVAFAEED